MRSGSCTFSFAMRHEETTQDAPPDERLSLIAYRLADTPLRLEPAAAGRDWMDATPERFAYRCLPLVLANQAGWFVVPEVAVRACWKGGRELDDILVEQEPPDSPPFAVSHFGSGILTFNIPFLFRTPPGYNLLVRGPANLPLDGAFPLDGLVEADWAVATFTMNWLLTRPGAWIEFPAGRPIAMLVPQARFDLERFAPAIRPIESAPELERAHQTWSDGRRNFNRDLKDPQSAAVRQRWQKHYFQGAAPDGAAAPQHQTKLGVRPFTED